MIPQAVLNQIQDRLDIVEVISAYVPLRRAGRNFKAPCPFHQEKTPSFMVNVEKQIFHCFGCGVGGGLFSFVMKMEKRDFPEVVEMLAERVGVELPASREAGSESAQRLALLSKIHEDAAEHYHQFLLTKKDAEGARDYLKKRGIGAETVRRFKLGYASEAWDGLYRILKGRCPDALLEKAGLVIARREGGYYDRFRRRVIFPILDAKGICVAFGGRVLDDSPPKYVNSPETELYSKGRHLYGFHQARRAIRAENAAIVVEGYMDLVACHQAGVENAVASLGTALTRDQVRLLKRNTQSVVMLYDADKAGELATLRGLELFLEEGLEVKIVRLLPGHDPDSYLREHGLERFLKALGGSKTHFEYKLEVLKEKHSFASLEGRVKAANEMVALFSKVPNEILRAAWLKELSREVGIPQEALAAEMRKAKNGFKTFEKEEKARSAAPKKDLPVLEKQLIGLLLDSAEHLARGREELSADDFYNAGVREIAKRILESETALSAAQAVNLFKENLEAAEVISQACAETEAMVDKEKAFEDCLLRVRQRRILNRRQGLEKELLAAEREGDANRVRRILSDFNELNKGIKRIHEKK